MRLRATRLSAFSHAARRPSGPLYAFLDGIPPALAGAFSRTGLGTRIGPTGLVEFGPHNLALQSENLASAAYAAWAATVVSGATTPPAGFQSADRLVEGSGIQLRGQSFALVNGTTYTQICRAKAGTRHFLVARNQQGTRWAVINLSTGQIHDAGSGFAITVNPLNDGWWEVACKFICGATGNFEVQWGISATGTNSSISFDSYVGSGLGLYLTGWQLVVGSITTYVPTATAARYLPRIDHDPVTLAARGLLIEGQGINRARTTNNLLSTEWAVSGCTRAQAAVVAPDGSLSAVTITGSSGLDCVFFEGQGSTFAAGDVTVSFHVRKGSADFAIVSIWAGTGLNGVNAWIDLNTLAVSASSATAGHAFKSCVVKRLTNGFALVELTGTWAGGIAYPSVRMTDASGSGVYTATVGKTLIVAMPQIEAGTVATSHIQNPGSGTAVRTQDGNWDITGEPFTALWGAPTYGADLLAGAGSFASSAGWTAQTGWSISGGAATATGASSLLFYAAGIVPGKEYLVTFDVVSRSAGTIGVSFNPDAFTTTFDTVGTKSVLLRAGASANGNVSLVGSSFTGSIDNFTISEVIRERTIIVEWWDRGLTFADILIAHGSGSIVESIGLYKFANTNLQFWSRSGGVNQFSSLIGVPVVGRNRAAFSFGGGNFAVSLNGATPVLGTGNVPSPNTLRIAGDAQISGGGYQMTLTSLDSRPTALTGAALQALSAL